MILQKILRDKKIEVAGLKAVKSLTIMKKEASRLPKCKNKFSLSLKQKKEIAVIAEVKRRSPSKGLLSKNFEPVRIAREYVRGGAAALSVLTDKKYFGGSGDYIKKIKKVVSLPVLRKDFIIEEYQVYESRVLGADAILLIVCALSRAQMGQFYRTAKKLGLEVLFEVHDDADLKKVLPLKPRLIGINNRDLRDFRVDLNVTYRLAPKVPKQCLLVSESGISGPADISKLKKYGVRAVLVGETLMKATRPGDALKRLLGIRHG